MGELRSAIPRKVEPVLCDSEHRESRALPVSTKRALHIFRRRGEKAKRKRVVFGAAGGGPLYLSIKCRTSKQSHLSRPPPSPLLLLPQAWPGGGRALVASEMIRKNGAEERAPPRSSLFLCFCQTRRRLGRKTMRVNGDSLVLSSFCSLPLRRSGRASSSLACSSPTPRACFERGPVLAPQQYQAARGAP